MSFLDTLEKASSQASLSKWKGSFRQFLNLFESGEYQNLCITSHQRIYNMIINSGIEHHDYYGVDRISYKFFEDVLFGVEDTVDKLMSFIHGAAQKTEMSRRMLLIYGPPGSGKSRLAQLIKQGLEKYTRTKQGAVFAISGSQMHEDPFLLVPVEMRSEFEKNYNVKIDGHLSPISRYRLDNEYNGNFMEFPVEQVYFSEAGRIGIGTFLPVDAKSQDISELIGGIDFSKIQDVGNESDPRSFNFDGEFQISNRGVIEMVEALKGEESLLRPLLTVTQEKLVKAPRFGFIFVDLCVIIHTNENEFLSFIKEKKYEAYHDRMFMMPAPYNVCISDEIKIYQQMLDGSDATKDMHIAPKTINAAAMFAVLTRLEPAPDGSDLSLEKKMKLYDRQQVRGYKIDQVLDLKKKSPREGMFGISPRFVIDQIVASISRARDENRNFITALDVLKQINSAIIQRDIFTSDQKTSFRNLLDLARREWNEMLRNDIQKAFFLSFDDESRNLCANYLDQIEASCSSRKPRDPVTGEEVEVDDKLMESIEDQIGISRSGREDFRNEVLRAVALAGMHDKKFDYTQHAQLREAIQKQLFEERQSVIRMTTTTRNPDKDELKRINEVISQMNSKYGYSAESANELLKYATAHLFDK